jgi:hypothetical protein
MGGYDSGNRSDQHHPVGLSSTGTGYTWRPILKFNLDWTDVAQITSARIYLRMTGGEHTGLGANFNMTFALVTGTFSQSGSGDGENLWSSSVSPKRSTEPAVSGTYVVSTGSTARSYNTWFSWDITSIVERWAPSTVKMSGGSPGPGTANNGIRIISSNEASSSVTSEWYSKESAYDPYIVLTYSTNTAPSAPTPTGPTSGSTLSSQTPNITFTHVDADSDPIASWDLQVDTTTGNGIEPDWASLSGSGREDVVNSVAEFSGNNVTHAATSKTRGQWYAWRARTADSLNGDGAWCATQYFYIAQQPTVTVTQPISGGLGKTYYTAGSGTTPKVRAEWNYSCPDGHAQQSASCRLYTAADALLETATVTGTATYKQMTYAIVNGTQYRFEMDVTCTAGVTSTVSTRFSTRFRWGRASYYYNTATTPVSWSTPTVSTTEDSTNAIVMEYGASATTAEPGTYYSTVGSVPLLQYFFHRATLLAWGASPVSPSLNQVVIGWSATGLAADHWALASAASIDTSTQIFGTQSLKHPGNAATQKTTQTVDVLPGMTYILSARVKTDGNTGARVRVEDMGSNVLATSATLTTATDWVDGNGRPVYQVAGPFTAGSSQVKVALLSTTTDTTLNTWFDAVKLEASAVVTPWAPGYVGGGVSIDAGGLQVDAQKGGIFRVRGSTGGARDYVDVGTNGWRFGGDTPLYSPAANILRIDSGLRLNSDTQINRSAAKTLTFDDAAGGALTKIVLTGSPFIEWGGDTNIYRSAANTLKTDDALVVTGILTSTTDFNLGGRQMTGAAPIVRVYTTLGANTWTKPSNFSHIIVECQGAGGGGGGADATAGSEYSGGAGGGGGGYARKLFTAADLAGAASFTATVGTGGTAGANTGGAGGAGGASTFSGTGITTVSGGGGAGGASGVASGVFTIRAGGTGGTSSGGDINMVGGDGAPFMYDAPSVGRKTFGTGGSGHWGGGATVGSGSTNAGQAGGTYGGGGSGGHNTVSQVGQTGGAGAQGIVIVTEYYFS